MSIYSFYLLVASIVFLSFSMIIFYGTYHRSLSKLYFYDEINSNNILRIEGRLRELEKLIDEQVEYLHGYIKDINMVSTSRAQYVGIQFDFLRSEIQDIKRHLEFDLVNLEYMPHKPERDDGDLGQRRDV